MAEIQKITEPSKRFEELKARFERGGCTKGQLYRFSEFGVLTPEEYKEIAGEDNTWE